MKKLLIRIGMVLVMLLLLNWVYSKWLFEKDLRQHSDIVELSWQVVDDSCRIIYLGESSNNNYGEEESNHRKISDFTSDYFPTVKMGDLTKAASHAQTYYYMLKHIPQTSSIETVVVTMNLRSFGPNWIYSRLETALRKQLVLLEDNPPLVNRFLLALKAYPIHTEAEWDSLVYLHRKTDSLHFPYDVEWSTNYAWDSVMAWRGWAGLDGLYDLPMTQLACHYIKSYGFQIVGENPRIKDFDAIVELCHKRGWNLVFNLMAENVDKANELVGKDLMFLVKQNRDYLLNRYGHLNDVMVVDNLNLIRDVNFIDQDWTTEHYYEEGRRIIAHHLAQTLRTYYPNDYQDPETLKYDAGHYYFEGYERALNAAMPYSTTLVLPSDSLHPDWKVVNVAFEAMQSDTSNRVALAIEKDGIEGKKVDSYAIRSQILTNDRWDFVTLAIPLDSTIRETQQIKIYVYNMSESVVWIKNLDISFRPAYLKPRVKAQSERE